MVVPTFLPLFIHPRESDQVRVWVPVSEKVPLLVAHSTHGGKVWGQCAHHLTALTLSSLFTGGETEAHGRASHQGGVGFKLQSPGFAQFSCNPKQVPSLENISF